MKIVFDTNCVLCSGFVRFILKHEKNHDIIFVKAWSETGRKLAEEYNLSQDDLHKTYLVISDGNAFVRSQAGMEILRHLKAPWRWLRILRFIPIPLRDWVYSLVARHRYKWFGYEENCFVSSNDNRHRFIDV